MGYTIKELTSLSGVTARALRYYEKIGLLEPVRLSNGYRCYHTSHVDRLQQILLYQEMGFSLARIKQILDDPQYNRLQALEEQLYSLRLERSRLDCMIENVTRTILSTKGEVIMNDKEKFNGMVKKLIQQNEDVYGEELRQKYGKEKIEHSYQKLSGMTPEEFNHAEALSQKINFLLKTAIESNDPASEEAQLACDLHRQWLCCYWPEGTYSKAAHRNLSEMYTADERFRVYYEAIAPGCAEFFRNAIHIYCQEKA